jgi:hypothetical protein
MHVVDKYADMWIEMRMMDDTGVLDVNREIIHIWYWQPSPFESSVVSWDCQAPHRVKYLLTRRHYIVTIYCWLLASEDNEVYTHMAGCVPPNSTAFIYLCSIHAFVACLCYFKMNDWNVTLYFKVSLSHLIALQKLTLSQVNCISG